MFAKKNQSKKMRGTSSHGWGHKKKHRGAGHRGGGKGLSGTGARGDAQKPGILSGGKEILQKIAAQRGVKMTSIKRIGNKYFGKRGFTSIHKKNSNVLSLSFIENNYEKLVEDKKIVKDSIDTVKLGYDKVLGRTKLSRKLNIICNEISDSAKAQVEAAGGTVKVLKIKKIKTSSEDSVEE